MKLGLRTLFACCTLLAFTGTGCSRGFDIHTPPSFAELDEGDYAYRATSAEGVVIAVRREANDPKGNLAFWSAALDHELGRKGYTRITSKDVKSADGVPGKQIRYTTTRQGRPNTLWTTVYVSGSHVIVVEAGGDEAHFEGVEHEIEQALGAVNVS